MSFKPPVLDEFHSAAGKLAVAERWYDDTALEDLLGVPLEKINDTRLYRGLDALHPHKDAICQHLLTKYRDWFGVRFEFLLYDVTSTFFEGQALRNAKAARGYSRDNRPDCKQVCIGLVVTPEGLPVGYEVFAGNRADVTTVQDIVTVMEKKYGQAERVWVLDRGMVSEDNLAWLRERQALYLVQTAPGPIYPARLFEAICVVVAEKYLGGRELGAKAYHFGAPRPDRSGFSTALKALAESIKGKQQGIIEPDAEKDDGLDVLAWRPFADLHCNFMCLFGQCATGADWPSKNPEPKEFMNVWLRLETPAVNPALFVPFTLSPVDWVKKSQSLVVFDRCRISALVPRIEHGASHELVRALVSRLLAA